MATATRSTSMSSSKTLNGASRSAKRVSRSVETQGREIGKLLSREGAALAKRASAMYATARTTTRNHPMATIGLLAGAAALIGGLWYASRR
jgi:ElaB/YqjD/DUF883 family membrane-anchored ribosome-binding protein